ncbi:MAG: hypothetical protein ACP5NK_03560 [Thermoplasmata archaeon]
MKEMIPCILEWIFRKSIVCTTLDRDGRIVRRDDMENSFEKLREFLGSFPPGDRFVMESTEDQTHRSLLRTIYLHKFSI